MTRKLDLINHLRRLTPQPAPQAAKAPSTPTPLALDVTDTTSDWRPVTASGQTLLIEPPWSDRYVFLTDIMDLWRNNPMAWRITALTTDAVVGNGVSVRSPIQAVQAFVDGFWHHPENDLDLRIYRWSDELVRTGELFIVLNRDPVSGMTFVRELPAILVDDIEVDLDDLENEQGYHQLTPDTAGKWWPSVRRPESHRLDQVVLHYTVNKPAGATRGTPDLLPITKWIKRYDEWLTDRIRLNKWRSAFLWHCKITNPAPGEIDRKRAQYAKRPSPGAVLVTDDKEDWDAKTPNLGAFEAETDGHALRLIVAAGAGIPLHFLSEGESATRSTAREMNGPTYRHLTHRQNVLTHIVMDVVTHAIRRASVLAPGDLQLSAEVTDLTRDDNEALAASAKDIVNALGAMRAEGWIDDYHAASIALRFAGELLPPAEIEEMLKGTEPRRQPATQAGKGDDNDDRSRSSDRATDRKGDKEA